MDSKCIDCHQEKEDMNRIPSSFGDEAFICDECLELEAEKERALYAQN